jgi:3-hydroxyisobutyrate dehydrogenase
MASSVSKMKLPKLVEADYSVQASIADVLKNSRLVVEEARHASVAAPVMDQCFALFSQTNDLAL